MTLLLHIIEEKYKARLFISLCIRALNSSLGVPKMTRTTFNYDWIAWNKRMSETDILTNLERNDRFDEMNHLQEAMDYWTGEDDDFGDLAIAATEASITGFTEDTILIEIGELDDTKDWASLSGYTAFFVLEPTLTIQRLDKADIIFFDEDGRAIFNGYRDAFVSQYKAVVGRILEIIQNQGWEIGSPQNTGKEPRLFINAKNWQALDLDVGMAREDIALDAGQDCLAVSYGGRSGGYVCIDSFRSGKEAYYPIFISLTFPERDSESLWNILTGLTDNLRVRKYAFISKKPWAADSSFWQYERFAKALEFIGESVKAFTSITQKEK